MVRRLQSLPFLLRFCTGPGPFSNRDNRVFECGIVGGTAGTKLMASTRGFLGGFRRGQQSEFDSVCDPFFPERDHRVFVDGLVGDAAGKESR